MAQRLQVVCTRGCGPQTLPAGEAILVRCIPRPHLSYVEFICPSCSYVQQNNAPRTLWLVIIAQGVRTAEYPLPQEVLERPYTDEAPPLELDDLIDLGRDLERL